VFSKEPAVALCFPAVAALAVLRPPDELSSCGGRWCLRGLGAESTKRKRDGQINVDDESGAHEQGSDDAAPLC
jgi:hypothetical protein